MTWSLTLAVLPREVEKSKLHHYKGLQKAEGFPKAWILSKNQLKKSDTERMKNLLLPSQNNPKKLAKNSPLHAWKLVVRTLVEIFFSNSKNNYRVVIFFSK